MNHAPQAEMEKAALITQLVCSAINLDYAARMLQAKRPFSGNAKRRLNLLTNSSDAFVAEAIKAFDFADADGINALSDVMTLHTSLLLQLSPGQIEAVLKHMTGMLESGAVYTPALAA